MNDILLGLRFAVSGGRNGWTRTLLTALGVAAGVAVLLLAAAAPTVLAARQAREAARYDMSSPPEIPAGTPALLVADFETQFRDQGIRGRLVRPQTPDAPLPPGVTALPRPGELVVSPALRKLLTSPDGDLLRPRFGDARIVGEIAPAGLAGPRELAFYLGSDTLPAEGSTRALTAFGDMPTSEPYPPVLVVLVVIIVVVLLLPVVVFLGTTARFGNEQRDRRLAALRLVGADQRMTRRVAAGESLGGALAGLLLGAMLFAAGRQVVPLVDVAGFSAFPADIRPVWPLAALVVLVVPALVVAITIIAMRDTLVEPLGVTRRVTPTRRRLWWRLLPPAAGLVLLYPLLGRVERSENTPHYQVAAGAVLLLTGAVLMLPWLLDRVVGALHRGPVSWQLAVRRLQLDSTGAARAVGGVTVAVAGAIGLQLLFTGVDPRFTERTGQDPDRAQVLVQLEGGREPDRLLSALAAVPGVGPVHGTVPTIVADLDARPRIVDGTPLPPISELRIGDCTALGEFARLNTCRDGDVFLVDAPDESHLDGFAPGHRTALGDGSLRWLLPSTARTVPARPDPMGRTNDLILVTPAAATPGLTAHGSTEVFVRSVSGNPDTVEHLRNTVARFDQQARIITLTETRESERLTTVRRGLYVGTVVTLLLIATSILVGVLEQLRERRRTLAMLVAAGTPWRVLAWSALWQAAVPVIVGLTLALVFGVGFGLVLQRMVTMPLAVDWASVGIWAGLGLVVVLLSTAASLPTLRRLVRADNLRAE